MPKLNKIWGFVAVGFVLVFFAKINKVSLYTAYFKTITEVEIRNSADLDQRLITHQISDLDLAGRLPNLELPLTFALLSFLDLDWVPETSGPSLPGEARSEAHLPESYSPSTPIRGPGLA